MANCLAEFQLRISQKLYAKLSKASSQELKSLHKYFDETAFV
jgi:hypothetical protein